MTVLGVLQASTGYLQKHRVESARLNAEHLLAHVLGRKRLELYLEFERELDETELAPLRELVRRRGEGEPLQHLLGTVEFCGRVFVCDKRAMVPRPETEQLVEILIDDSLAMAIASILDVGTGSGVIALSLAGRFPQARISAVDVSDEALALAGENASRLGLEGRVQFRKGNLLEQVDERFDLIVANLPYISMQDQHSLSREVRHDPGLALFGGSEGDELIRTVIEQAPDRLRPGGLLALEIGAGQSAGLIALLNQKKYKDIQLKNDYSGTPRFVLARYG